MICKALQAFVVESAYNVLKSTNAIMCSSASTSTSACGRKVLEAPPSISKNVLKVLSSTSTLVLAPCLIIIRAGMDPTFILRIFVHNNDRVPR